MSRLTLVTLLVLATSIISDTARAEERSHLAALAGTRTEVYVTSIDAIERKGRITAVADDGLRLTFGGRETFVPWEEVVTVDRRGDPVWDGAARGAGIAAVLYAAVALAAGADAGEALQFAGSAALAWGSVGAIVDAFNVGRSSVYVGTPEPSRSYGQRGLVQDRGLVIGAKFGF